MGLLAEGKIVRLVELYKWRPTPWRLDVWPFIGLYIGWVLGVATRLDATDAGIVLAGLTILHILTFLFSAWSVDFRCFVQATQVRALTLFEAVFYIIVFSFWIDRWTPKLTGIESLFTDGR